MFERLRRKLLGAQAASEAEPTPRAEAAEVRPEPISPITEPAAETTSQSATATASASASASATASATEAISGAAEPGPFPQAAAPSAPAGEIGATVSFDQRRYALSQLADDVRQLVVNLEKAEQLIRLKRDKRQLLARGREQLAERLRQGLQNVAPLD